MYILLTFVHVVSKGEDNFYKFLEAFAVGEFPCGGGHGSHARFTFSESLPVFFLVQQAPQSFLVVLNPATREENGGQCKELNDQNEGQDGILCAWLNPL